VIGARTARLVIEPMAHAHAEELVAAITDPAPGERPAWPEPATVESTHARIEHLARGLGDDGARWFNFVMRRADDGVLIGRLEASTHGAWGEIAYVLGPRHQRLGFAREGVRWLLDSLRAAGVTELWACIAPANASSIRLVAALGFVPADPAARPLGSYEPGDAVFRTPSRKQGPVSADPQGREQVDDAAEAEAVEPGVVEGAVGSTQATSARWIAAPERSVAPNT